MPESVENSESQVFFFCSEYKFGIDDKRRLQIPAKWRKVPGVASLSLLIWPKMKHQESYILAMPPKVFLKLKTQVEEMPFGETNADTLRRTLGARLDQVTMDSAYRICLSERMVKVAGLKKRALLVGAMDRFQIWDPERYAKTSDQDESQYEELIQRI